MGRLFLFGIIICANISSQLALGKGSFVLVGVISSGTQESIAVIKDTLSKQTYFLREGESITLDGPILEKISIQNVILNTDGNRQILDFEGSESSTNIYQRITVEDLPQLEETPDMWPPDNKEWSFVDEEVEWNPPTMNLPIRMGSGH